MINAKNANYLQIDHKVKSIFSLPGVIILPSSKAWTDFKWTRPFFVKKPKEGYFIWVKKQISFPLATCLAIASPKIFQDLNNLMVIEKGIQAKANVVCQAIKNNLSCSHSARGKLVLKEGAGLEYNHFHQWGQKDSVSPDYEFILKKGSHLVYNYKNLLPAKNVSLKTTIYAGKNSSANLNFIFQGKGASKIDIYDALHLEGEGSQGIVKLRLVGKDKSKIRAKSLILAKSLSKGHLDCQGLLVDKGAEISLMPELTCLNKKAQLTHEASIGKISEEELNYLRMRGLREKEAIDLIVSGFLKQ